MKTSKFGKHSLFSSEKKNECFRPFFHRSPRKPNAWRDICRKPVKPVFWSTHANTEGYLYSTECSQIIKINIDFLLTRHWKQLELGLFYYDFFQFFCLFAFWFSWLCVCYMICTLFTSSIPQLCLSYTKLTTDLCTRKGRNLSWPLINNNNNILLGSSITKSGLHRGPNKLACCEQVFFRDIIKIVISKIS